MRFSVAVANAATGQRHQVLVDADPETSVSDLLPVLVAATGGGEMHASFAARVPMWVEGDIVDPERTVREAGIQPGSAIALHEPADGEYGLPHGVVELRVVSGPGSGRVHRLGIGDHEVGFGAPAMSLPDVLLPAAALRIRVTTEATIEIVSTELDVRIDGRDPGAEDPEAADDPDYLDDAQLEELSRKERRQYRRTRKRQAKADAKKAKLADKAAHAGTAADEMPGWPEGAELRIGDTLLQWRKVWNPDADVSPSEDRLGIDFNRPPRLLPPARERTFVLPRPPGKKRKVTVPWPMVFAPMLMSVPMALLFNNPRFLMFAFMSPMMALFNFVSQKRGGAQAHRVAVAEYEREHRNVSRRIARSLRMEREELRTTLPDPASLLLHAVGPGQRLWNRRRADPDYLALRIGVADRPTTVSVTDRSVKETDEAPEPETQRDVPVAVSLRDDPVIGAAGDPEGVEAMVRWFLGQSAVLHAPDDLRIVVLAGPDSEAQWGWLRWLPHCRRDGEPVAAFLGTDQDSVSRRLGELTQLITERLDTGSGFDVGKKDSSPAPDFLVVLDGARRLRALPGVVNLLRDGPAAGIRLLCLDEDERSLPEECQTVLTSRGGVVEMRRTETESVHEIRPDLVEPQWAERVARALAPVRDATPSEQASSLPSSARLLEVIDMADPTPSLVKGRWDPGPAATTDVVIGAGFDGPFRLDLRKDGPHALVAGTTGSGKSEFLQTIVASLALANSPEQLTFVLVDYKGGSAFADCAQLPHTVGMVTDLDTHLVSRALTSLGAELRRREHLLAGPGAKDLEDYWALQRNDPSLPTIPRLAIVIDEFASLKAELPDFVTGLVTIAQRGRSLGIHLVLATQRPSGVISNDIRANTNLRIALRMTDGAESRDVIDATEAATIGADQPGRGYARLGHTSLLPFQSGRVGGARPQANTQAEELPSPLAWAIDWSKVGLPAPVRPKPRGQDTDEGDTDLSVLVTAAIGATDELGMAEQHSPWLPEVPSLITVADLTEREGVREVDEQVLGWSTPWALEDHPEDQIQLVRRFVLGSSGHLAIVGGPRSGRSTALRTLTVGLARQAASRDLHLYGLDCGNGALLPLIDLPQCGAVVQRTEVERASRLLDRLGEEVKRRQDVLGQSGYADIDEQRRAVAADERLPYVVLAIDRWEGFVSDLADVDMGRLNDRVFALLREGASVGVHLLVAGDRTLLSGRISSMFEHKLMLRLPDRSDYSQAGLRPKDMPDDIVDGRAFWSESGMETQIATLTRDVTGAAQSEEVRRTARELIAAESDQPAPVSLRPFSLAALPTTISATTALADALANDTGFVPLGVGGDQLALVTADALSSPALVVGAARSGRTNTLQFVATYARAQGHDILGITPTANALSAQLQDAAVVGTDAEPDALAGKLRDLSDGAFVVVDDAEQLREGPLAPVMLALMRQSRERGFRVVLAGDINGLSQGFSGWLVDARKGRRGLILSPQEAMQGDIFGGRVARTSLTPRIMPGRGVLFDGTGDQVGVQVPLVEE